MSHATVAVRLALARLESLNEKTALGFMERQFLEAAAALHQADAHEQEQQQKNTDGV